MNMFYICLGISLLFLGLAVYHQKTDADNGLSLEVVDAKVSKLNSQLVDTYQIASEAKSSAQNIKVYPPIDDTQLDAKIQAALAHYSDIKIKHEVERIKNHLGAIDLQISNTQDQIHKMKDQKINIVFSKESDPIPVQAIRPPEPKGQQSLLKKAGVKK